MKRAFLLFICASLGFLPACTSSGTAFNPPGGIGPVDSQLVVGMKTSTTTGLMNVYAPPYSGAPSVSNVATGEPWNMAADGHGNLWVATGYALYGGSHAVLEYTTPLTASSTPAITIPTSATGATEGVAFDSSGDLWVATWSDNTIREFKPPFSNASTAALSITNGLHGPEGLAFDAHGNLWVCNTATTPAIEEFTPPLSSSSSPAFSITNGGTLSTPQQVAFNSAGDMFVADEATAKVYEFAPPFSSSSTASVTLGFSSPQSLALDSSGDLWVTDRDTNSVYEFKPPFSNASTPALTVTNGVSSPWGLTFVK
ncbi:MAG: hypothetical protein ACREMP_08720 [Candidatus Tyrphobacter sp.]